MNSVSRNFTVRVSQDSLLDHVSAFRTALALFGTAQLSEFLPPPEHPRYLEMLSELVRVELAHGWKNSAPTPVETYQARYPDLFANAVLAYPILQDDFQMRQQAQAAPISPLDPAVSSKFDIVLQADDSANYPPTARPQQKDESWPSAEVGQTRPGLPGDKRFHPSSEADIAWKLTEAMLELPKVGDEFLGFSLLAELGKGGFGKVFLAQQAQLAGRLVALKVATGLFSESQTLAQLQHTHIVPIYSYHHGQPFQAVCMPYLGSTTLAHVLADIRAHKTVPSSGKELLSTLNDRKKSTRRFEDSSSPGSSDSLHDSLPDSVEMPAPVRPATSTALLELEGMSYIDSILWLAVRLADGLAHAHERGIIHRDLKPANILLTDDGLPMLLDFNLAQDTKVRDSAAAASIGGTLPYMAPEHLDAFRKKSVLVDGRSDLYSLGVILFELLTGAAPFPTYSKMPTQAMVERMIQDRRAGAPRLRVLNPAITPAVEAIVRRCLEADPAKRYPTVRQLREDLQCQLDHQPLLHAGNPSLRERVQKFRKRHPRLTSVTSVALAFCLLIAGLSAGFAVREEQHRRLEARDTLTRFREDAQSAYFLLNARTARDHLDEGQRACKATLAHFEVLDNPAWRDGPAARRLPADERQLLDAEVGQLLVLLAHAQQLAGEREADPARRQELFHEGVQFCSTAADCFGDAHAPVALWKQKADLHDRLGQADSARACLERARQTDVKTAQDRYLTARLLAEEGKFRDALQLVQQAVRQNPQDFNLHFLEGICHDHLSRHADAIACYRTCIALRPQFYASYFNRGTSYLCLDNHKAALADFDQTVQLNPDFAPVYAQRALAWEKLDKHAEAIADLTEALERNLGQTRLYFLRGKLREKTGDLPGARKDFAEGMRREPADELSSITRGLAFLPGNPQRALSDFDKALEHNPRSLAALVNKAHVLGKYFKKTEEAVAVLDKAIQHYPDDVRPLAGRGVYLARLGKRDAALKDAEQALLIDTHPANLYQVAGIYAMTSKQVPDDRQEAMRLLSAALKKGFGFEYLEIDRDLDPIRALPTFRRVIDGARALQSVPSSKRP